MTSPDQSTPPFQPPPLPARDAIIAEAVSGLGAEAWWAIDIVPLLRPQETDPLARFAVLFVMAQDVVIHTEFIRHPGADHAVELIVYALRAAAHKSGVWPELLLVRGEGFNIVLQDTLDDSAEIPEIRVYGVMRFSEYAHPDGATVDATILDLRHHMDGVMIPDVPAASSPTWRAWGISLDRIEAFLQAIVDVYRSVAARRFAGVGDQGALTPEGEERLRRGDPRKIGGALLVIEEPEMCDALAVLFGEGDVLSTVMLFSVSEDWDAMVEAGSTDPVSADVHYPVACISFVEEQELWGGLAEEIAAHGWAVGGPAAYPTLWILNAEGGGMTTEYCMTITHQLEALSRAIVYGTQTPLHPESVFQYVDAPTGLIVRTAAAEEDE
jgi:hypothetical protein